MNQFAIGDVVQLQHLNNADYCADDFGVDQQFFDSMLIAQRTGARFIVVGLEANDGFDVCIEHCGPDDSQVELRPYHLKLVDFGE